jgi:hypothetical protein
MREESGTAGKLRGCFGPYTPIVVAQDKDSARMMSVCSHDVSKVFYTPTVFSQHKYSLRTTSVQCSHHVSKVFNTPTVFAQHQCRVNMVSVKCLHSVGDMSMGCH